MATLYYTDLIQDTSGWVVHGIQNSAAELTPDDAERIKRASSHQIIILPDAGATGTIKIAYAPAGSSSADNYVMVKDSLGADVVIDLADLNQQILIDAVANTFIITPFTAIDGGYQAAFAGW